MISCPYCGTKMKFIKGNDYFADKLYCPKCKWVLYVHNNEIDPISYNNCQVED